MILVTGAAGTVGSEVVKQLKDEKARFHAAFHSKEKAEEALAKGIETVVIDYNRPETLLEAFRGIDKLFLLAPATLNQEQMELNAVDAAKKSSISHIVKQSVWEADQEAYIFGKVHRSVEKAIEASGMSWTFMRPNSFMQNVVNYMSETIKSEGAFYSAAGDAKIAHIDVRDIAAVAVKALTESDHEGKAYTLSGPEALTYDELAAELSNVLGHKINHINLSPSDMKHGMVSEGVPEEYADMLIDLDRYFQTGQAGRVTNDIKQVTGHEPRRFEQYAREYASMLQAV